MSSSLPPLLSCSRRSPMNEKTETDKRVRNCHQGEMLTATMEEGVDIHAYEDSLHYNAYAFDVGHPNSVVDTGNPLEDVVVVGTKRPLEETTTAVAESDPMSLATTTAAKRYKTNDEGRRNTAAAAATNKQWDAMFERLVAFKQRNGVRGTHDECRLTIFARHHKFLKAHI